METIIFLVNSEINKSLTSLIKSKISDGEYYKIAWSCGNSKFIKVGSRAYFKRSGNIGNEPLGFIAAGYVIAAPEDDQLRLINRTYSDLSEAYVGHYYGCFSVLIQIDSVVDFNFPLEQKELRKLSQFQGVNFNFGGGGCRFSEEASHFLDSEWEKHSLKYQRIGKGCRLIDVIVERGNAFKGKQEYEDAINQYRLALKVDSKYAKAINQINNCELILKRINEAKTIQPPPTPPLPIKNNELLTAREELDKEKFFRYRNDTEARQKIYVSIARRQGQSKFRQDLLEAYSSRCAITNFDAEEALEAAHIIPYIATENNHPSNGLLLRADLHTLFDLNLIAINPKTMMVHISPTLGKTEYRAIEGKELRVPKNEMHHPSLQFLKKRCEMCEWFKYL
ncbi:HNH endonuclease [Anabaena sp. CCY 9402-a]|uniref:HNH endonuclease n=1 Tax=Anabaena sp. CCY 9402-a TaxID=3103867 RepID=UPI0039C65D05